MIFGILFSVYVLYRLLRFFKSRILKFRNLKYLNMLLIIKINIILLLKHIVVMQIYLLILILPSKYCDQSFIINFYIEKITRFLDIQKSIHCCKDIAECLPLLSFQ